MNLSFWNGPIMLRPKFMKKWVIWRKNYTQINKDCLSSSYVINTLDNVDKDIVVVPIDKATVPIDKAKFMPLLLLENWDWIKTHL